MSVTTKTGDQGMTSLFTGERIAKDDMRVEVYGAVDSLGSTLGMARAFVTSPEVKERIYNLQKQLGVPELQEFIIPGDKKSSAMLDLARTTARAAERHAWTLARRGSVAEIDLRYLNRLSDYIFILMRLEDQDKPNL